MPKRENTATHTTESVIQYTVQCFFGQIIIIFYRNMVSPFPLRCHGFLCEAVRASPVALPAGACHDSSRVSAMPTSRAYDTRYAIHLNMLTHDSHGLHAVIINMDLRVHGHALYKRRHACSTTTNGCLG